MDGGSVGGDGGGALAGAAAGTIYYFLDHREELYVLAEAWLGLWVALAVGIASAAKRWWVALGLAICVGAPAGVIGGALLEFLMRNSITGGYHGPRFESFPYESRTWVGWGLQCGSAISFAWVAADRLTARQPAWVGAVCVTVATGAASLLMLLDTPFALWFYTLGYEPITVIRGAVLGAAVFAGRWLDANITQGSVSDTAG